MLPSAPFDAVDKAHDIDPLFTNELSVHYQYMFQFRVQICEQFLKTFNCPYENQCFHAHAKTARRR
jgi:hypothetical protein